MAAGWRAGISCAASLACVAGLAGAAPRPAQNGAQQPAGQLYSRCRLLAEPSLLDSCCLLPRAPPPPVLPAPRAVDSTQLPRNFRCDSMQLPRKLPRKFPRAAVSLCAPHCLCACWLVRVEGSSQHAGVTAHPLTLAVALAASRRRASRLEIGVRHAVGAAGQGKGVERRGRRVTRGLGRHPWGLSWWCIWTLRPKPPTRDFAIVHSSCWHSTS